MLSTILYIALALFALGFSIFIHELGHFIAAKKRGLIADRFSIGFGPRLFGWHRNGTDFRLSLLPLGGYVSLPQLADMGRVEGGEKEEDKNAVMSLFSDVNPKDPLRPIFAPLGKQNEKKGEKAMYRKVNVPSHRLSPLKEHWMALYTPVTKQMKIDMRMNLKLKKVELKTTDQTEDESALQKSADFIQAFVLGFEIQDAVALLRLDDLYLECFEVKDVKQTLRGEHMSRGIGRLAGKSGKTKYTIENATRTRIVIADQHIRILGSFQNIKVARNALCALIMGSPPGKVYSRLRTVTARLAERF